MKLQEQINRIQSMMGLDELYRPSGEKHKPGKFVYHKSNPLWSKLDDLSGNLVGNDENEYILVQQDLSIFPYTRQDLIDLDPEYADEEIWRLESIKQNFEKTPPIPEEGDGLHRIIAAKELGYKTILMWKKYETTRTNK
jgi:hypothetical protein